MILNSPYISGSLTVTGNITACGGVTISGSIASASYASNADLLDGLGSEQFVLTGSFNTFSSSILTYTGSANSRLGSIETVTGSNITRLGALEVTSGSNITRLGALEVASGSAITRLNSIETVTGSNITRLSSLEARTGSFATTGSNTFDGGQYLSSSFNPTGFSTTASLYTDGGLRVTRDAYISGTLYLNNVTVFGTQSVSYITSSQLNIASNIISVNTSTPSVRFGGLSVYDSGSTSLTGSILWDSQNNSWIYSNPSGSETYDSAMVIMGPRNSSTLGNEQGLNCNYLVLGHGSHHTTSSAIFHNGTNTCIPNALVGGTACFSGAVCGNSIDVGTLRYGDKTTNIGSLSYGTGYVTLETNNATAISLVTNGQRRMTVAATGESCFACQVCVGGMIALTNQTFGTPASESAFRIRLSDNGGVNNDPGIGLDGSSGGGEKMWFNALGGFYFNFGTNGSKINIDSAGVACFSSTICAQSITFCSNINNGFTPIRICNPNGGSSAFSEIALFNDTATQAGLFFNSSTRTADGGVCSLSLYNDAAAGSIRIRSVGCITLATGVGNINRFSINTNGLASFCCQVGIGTTPTFTFDVFGELGVYCTGGASEGGVSIQKDCAGKGGKIQSFGSSSYLVFTTNLSGTNYDRLKITCTGVVHPMANGTQDFGTCSLRWGTIYTSDLSLSNGIGDYTIVEGEDDLFLYNNKKGKVYKFALIEVDPTIATPKKS